MSDGRFGRRSDVHRLVCGGAVARGRDRAFDGA